MPVNPVYEEVTADVLGKIGPWQWMVTFIATLLMLPHFTTYCDDLFLLPYQGGHICVSPYNSTNLTNPCYVTNTNGVSSKCVEWKMLFLGYIKLKKTWLVYCQENVQLLYVAIISRSGMLCGAVVFGLTADRFGRRKIILISVIGQLPLRLLRMFTSSSIWFRVLTFFTSMFSVPIIFLALIIVCEISSNKCRTSLICVASLPYFWSMAASIPLARMLVYTEIAALTVVTLNIILLFIVLRYLPESPSWLLFNDKNQNAESIISKAAIRNKIQLCSDFKIRPVDYNAYETLDEETNYRKLFSNWNILKILASLCIIWLVGSFIWSQLLCLAYVKDSHDFADMSFLPIITVIIFTLWFLPILYPNKLEHRFLLGSGMFFTGLLTLGLHYSYKIKSDAKDYLEIGAFVTTSVAMSSMINMTPRLVAVNIRCTVTGLLIAMGQVGTIGGYLVHCFHLLDDILFTSLITSATLLVVLSCFLLPRVEGRELPDVIEDMDIFGTTAKPLRWACQRTHSATQEEVELAVHSMENSPQYKDLQENVATTENPPVATRSRFSKVFRK